MRVIAGARGHLATRTRVLNRNTTGGPTLGEGPDYNTGASQQAMSAEAPPPALPCMVHVEARIRALKVL